MATLNEFYIQTQDLDIVVEKLKDLFNIQKVTKGSFPDNFRKKYLWEPDAVPDFLVVGKTHEEWVTVRNNSFNKMVQHFENISGDLNCKTIVVSAQNTVDYYYYAVYEKGQKIREIAVCYGDDIETLNYGVPFEFEDEEPGIRFKESEDFIFDIDSIINYSEHLGLKLDFQTNDLEWILLNGESQNKRVSDVVTSKISKAKKPWWKFW